MIANSKPNLNDIFKLVSICVLVDSLNHIILLSKLRSLAHCLSWFSSYLSDRNQKYDAEMLFRKRFL